jgi:hypothetical protein
MEDKNILEEYLAQYPSEEGFWVTSDYSFFTDKNKSDALNHAKELEDKRIAWAGRDATELVVEEGGKMKKIETKAEAKIEDAKKAEGEKADDGVLA